MRNKHWNRSRFQTPRGGIMIFIFYHMDAGGMSVGQVRYTYNDRLLAIRRLFMRVRELILCIILAVAAIVAGCAKGSGPVSPIMQAEQSAGEGSQHYLWGYWALVLNPQEGIGDPAIFMRMWSSFSKAGNST